MRSVEVAGHAGVRLRVFEAGPARAPSILFLHGWSQSHASWRAQLTGPLAARFRLAALDLRGHGASDQPHAVDAYSEGAAWAEDLAAVIASLGLSRPVLVGWSYAGLVIGDYLRRCGDHDIGGVVLVGAMNRIGRDLPPGLMGDETAAAAAGLNASEPSQRMAAALAFAKLCFAETPEAETLARFAMTTLFAAAAARRGMFRRTDDFRQDYAGMAKPLRLIHGAEDRVVRLAMAEGLLAAAPAARLSVYEGVGHSPFAEAPERFDAEIAEFAAVLQAG